MDLPYSYMFENIVNASRNPSSTHVADAFLTRYFRDRLLKRAMGVIKWNNVPDHWEQNFMKYVLFVNGYFCVVETDKYGVIPLNCTLGGVGVMYQPTFCIVSNPRLRGIKQPIIHEDCELVKLNPDYHGIMDLVNFHAGKLALASESMDMNLWNSKLAYVFTARNKASAESFKKLFDKIMNGEPAVVQDKNLLDDEGKPSWVAFSQNLGQNFIAPEIFELMKGLERDFDRDIGIPYADNKRERLLTREVSQAESERSVNIDQWVEELNRCLDKVNAMFGLDISVEKRYNTDDEEGDIELWQKASSLAL